MGVFIIERTNVGKCLNCGNECDIKYCNNKCQMEYQHNQYLEKWKRNEINGRMGQYGVSSHIRQYLLEKYNNKCAKCGWNEINTYTKNIPIEVEHIDGNYQNNKEDNLIILCPNCHSLTNTYRALNIGKGRKSRLNTH